MWRQLRRIVEPTKIGGRAPRRISWSSTVPQEKQTQFCPVAPQAKEYNRDRDRKESRKQNLFDPPKVATSQRAGNSGNMKHRERLQHISKDYQDNGSLGAKTHQMFSKARCSERAEVTERWGRGVRSNQGRPSPDEAHRHGPPEELHPAVQQDQPQNRMISKPRSSEKARQR